MKQPLRTLLPYVVAIVVLTAPAADAVAAEPTLSRQDRQGPATVTATLLAPVTADGPLRVKVALDTHSVNLDDLAFENIVALRVWWAASRREERGEREGAHLHRGPAGEPVSEEARHAR